ncbi:MAG: hypothetical protein KKA10_13370 [Euryarchaeota archaeon]|nr:hypothetical protein [Euryarchaeota archaeon]MCG2738416.1 hypothetical protein [Candidatus Methanoperedenaceae archaeon]
MIILAVALLLILCPLAGGSVDPQTPYLNTGYTGFNMVMVIPLRDDVAPDVIVAGSTLERGKIIIENRGSEPLKNISIEIKLPGSLALRDDKNKTIFTSFKEIMPGESKSILFSVKPPDSIPHREKASFEVKAEYADSTGMHTETFSHEIEIIPPPSWATYGTVLASIGIIIFAVFALRKFHILERFTTVDLITIALLAGLIGVVFRWFWQTFNDLLGPFGGLLFTIPTVALMIVALQLVRKPGTATLLFTTDLMVCMVVWGTNITVWLGWYMMEGIVVDVLVFLFRMDYADKRSTAVVYGVARSFVAYWTFYFLFAPAVWHIYYAPWYAWMNIGISCIGGIIGGIVGYSTAVKMRGAVF